MTMYQKDIDRLLVILKTHKPKEVTMPNGSLDLWCEKCDEFGWPCTIMASYFAWLKQALAAD